MKRIISILLLFFVLASGGVSFAADRWVTAYSTGDYPASDYNQNEYVDSQTISYNKDDNNITYWIKITSPWNTGYTFLAQHRCNLTEKKIQILRSISYDEGILQRSIDTPNPDSIRIVPDSPAEKEINTVCKLVGRAPIFDVSTHRWKWIYSTDKITYSICMDYKDYDPITGRAIIYVKQKYLNGIHWTQTYICNLKENTIIALVGRVHSDQNFIVPDSIEERIFNAAVSLCRQ